MKKMRKGKKKIARIAKKATKAGDDRSFMGTIAKRLERVALAAEGGYASAGRQAIKEAGGALGNFISGHGTYETNRGTVERNSLFDGKGGGASSSFGSGARERGRECIGSLTAGAANVFVNNSMLVTPTNPFMFPMLWEKAQLWQKYRINGLVFEYVSTTAAYGSSSGSALGSVILAMSYNPNEPDFVSKPQMTNSVYALNARTDVSQLYGVECAKGTRPTDWLYTQSPDLQEDALPLINTCIGKMQWATFASTATENSVVGDLYVTYDIDFADPYQPEAIGSVFEGVIPQMFFSQEAIPKPIPLSSQHSGICENVKISVAKPPGGGSGLWGIDIDFGNTMVTGTTFLVTITSEYTPYSKISPTPTNSSMVALGQPTLLSSYVNGGSYAFTTSSTTTTTGFVDAANPAGFTNVVSNIGFQIAASGSPPVYAMTSQRTQTAVWSGVVTYNGNIFNIAGNHIYVFAGSGTGGYLPTLDTVEQPWNVFVNIEVVEPDVSLTSLPVTTMTAVAGGRRALAAAAENARPGVPYTHVDHEPTYPSADASGAFSLSADPASDPVYRSPGQGCPVRSQTMARR
jgi:hypothetical protein